jgi:hypothetical protein
MKVFKKQECKEFTQFELSKNVLHNLKHFDLTPTGKLVLLILVDCFNPENNAVVFPSMEFIADMAGIGLTATKQAIRDLILTGCIIKSKRGKIRGNYNKYLLTLKVRNLTSEQPENELFKQSDSDRFHEEQKIRTKKEQTTKVVTLKQSNSRELKTDLQILTEYAENHGATNIQGYINALKIKGVAADIIRQYREKEGVQKYWDNQAASTSELIKEYEQNILLAEPMPESFKALGRKLRGQKNKPA